MKYSTQQFVPLGKSNNIGPIWSSMWGRVLVEWLELVKSFFWCKLHHQTHRLQVLRTQTQDNSTFINKISLEDTVYMDSNDNFISFLQKVKRPRAAASVVPAEVAATAAATVQITVQSSPLSFYLSIQSLSLSYALTPPFVYARSNGSLLCFAAGAMDDARARIFVLCVTHRTKRLYVLRWSIINLPQGAVTKSFR